MDECAASYATGAIPVRVLALGRVLGWGAVGALGVLAWSLACPAQAPLRAEQGPLRLWAFDRDARCAIGLDAELFACVTLDVPFPLRAVPRSDGAVWVVCATSRHERSRRCIALLASGGVRIVKSGLGEVLDLALAGDDSALWIEADSENPDLRRVRRIYVGGGQVSEQAIFEQESPGHEDPDQENPDQVIEELYAGPGLRSILAQGELVLLGTDAGELSLLELPATRPPRTALSLFPGAALSDLRRGPRSDTFWALAAAGAGGLALVELDSGGALHALWTIELSGLEPGELMPVPGRESVWLASTSAPRALRFGAQGALELLVPDLPLRGLGRGFARADGGVVLAAPGAILCLDKLGHPLPGQGGFEFLSAVVPGASPADESSGLHVQRVR